MSEFDKLHEHLRECVDNDDNTGITEDGIEFNIFEWAFGLSVKAKKEHDQLTNTITEQDKVISELLKALRFCNKYAYLEMGCTFETGEYKGKTGREYIEIVLAKHKQSKGE